MNYPLLVGACLMAVLDWLAVAKQWRRVAYFAKPLTILLLFTWFVCQTGLQGAALWFGVGLLFSLAGDVFLLLPPRYFLFGLAAFSLTHLAYLLGFLLPLPTMGFLWVGMILPVIALLAFLVMRRVAASQLQRGLKKLVPATIMYIILISLMLVSALWTLFRTDWVIGDAVMVSLGAILFYISDWTNAWIRFVKPVRSGRVLVMVNYHLGQFLLMLGVVLNLRGG